MTKQKNKPTSKKKMSIVLTIAVFVFMASLDNAVLGIFPPINTKIAQDFNISVETILNITAGLNMFIIAFSSMFWGYLADKFRRKILMITGTIIWSIGVFIIALSGNFFQFILSQIITSIGLGCIATIGFSMLTDYVPQNWRGIVMSLWGLSQGFGGIGGSVIASINAYRNDWHEPFFIIAVLGLVFVVLYFFIKEPQRGAAEPELKSITESGASYEYKIEFHHIKELILKPSNKWLILQSFFMNMVTGILVLLPTFYVIKLRAAGLDEKFAITISGYLFALLQVGGIASIYFGYLGDQLKKKSYRWRAIIPAIALLVAVPLYIGMFSIPFKGIVIPKDNSEIGVFINLIQNLATNPLLLLMFILAIFATMAQSVNTPNWMALITEVNLPEHRSTVFGAANLVNGIARILASLLLTFLLMILGEKPNNYIYAFSIFQIFFVAAAFCYIFQARSSGKDIRRVKSTLNRRGRTTVKSPFDES